MTLYAKFYLGIFTTKFFLTSNNKSFLIVDLSILSCYIYVKLSCHIRENNLLY